MTDSDATLRKLNVCFFIPDFAYGGAQKQCILLLNELQRRDDVELTLIRFRRGPQDHLLDTVALNIEFLNVRSHFDPRAIVATAKIVRKNDIQIIVSWVRVCDVYSYFVRLLTPRVRWVLTQRNSRHANTLIFRLRDALGKTADAIAANSPGGVQLWQRHGARGRVYLVDNIAALASDGESERTQQSILYVGRLEHQKNIITMANAFIRLALERPTVRISICGDGPLRGDVEQIIAASTVSDRIEMLGFRSDVPAWMQQASILVSLSEHEGMPNVLMEGVQADCTIVASAIPEHTDFLGEGYPYLVSDWHDVNEAARVMATALDNPHQSTDLEYARQHLERMSPARVASSYMEIFRATASKRRRVRAAS